MVEGWLGREVVLRRSGFPDLVNVCILQRTWYPFLSSSPGCDPVISSGGLIPSTGVRWLAGGAGL